MAKNKEKLNLKQELFCDLYVNSEYFGNATKAYACAYDIDPDDVCSANASRLLRNDKVKARVNKLLDKNLTQEVVDRELIKLVLQNEDRASKISAIREYNRIRGRVAEKPEVEYVYRWATKKDLHKGATLEPKK